MMTESEARERGLNGARGLLIGLALVGSFYAVVGAIVGIAYVINRVMN